VASPPQSLLSRAAVVFGLVGIAFTQPLLDLMGQNPEFFIAGRYRSAQIIQFALIITLVPAVAIALVVLGATVLKRSVGDVVYLVVVFLLGAVFGNVLTRGIHWEGGRMAVLAGLVGGAAAVAVSRVRPGRMLLELLAVANVLFLFSFLMVSPTSDLIGASGSGEVDLGEISMEEPPGPVVVIVFDELPLSTLMSTDGTINEERYPAFARLEEASTWYRNASSDHHRTERAVPELLTGTVPAVDALPSYIDLPRNLITMFGSTIPVDRYEAITDMCPSSICEAQSNGSLDQALEDAGVVYGHRVLPRRLRLRLPAIDQAWGGFDEVSEGATEVRATGGGGSDFEKCQQEARERGEDPGRLCRWWDKSDIERTAPAQVAILEAQGDLVDTSPALNFSHVVLPHAPWTTNPWGTTIMAGAPDLVTDPADPAYEWSGRLQYQRHALQAGAADVALGDVLDDIEAAGAWEDATIVVMADHGTSLLPPVFGRDEVIPENEQEIHRIPMFIKAPGQTEAEVIDDPAHAIDLVPTLADLLDIELDWEFDGHSLLDGSEGTTESLLDDDIQPLFELVDRHAAQFPEGEDWVALAAVGDHAALVGHPLSDFDIGEPSSMSWAPDFEDEFDSLPNADGEAPQLLTGGVATPGDERPPELVVAVNGTIAGTIGGYTRGDASWRFGSVLGPYLRDGANEIVAYEVDGDVLRPLS
jgi:hypothetical protein